MSKTVLNLMHTDANKCAITIVFNFIITSMREIRTVKIIKVIP